MKRMFLLLMGSLAFLFLAFQFKSMVVDYMIIDSPIYINSRPGSDLNDIEHLQEYSKSGVYVNVLLNSEFDVNQARSEYLSKNKVVDYDEMLSYVRQKSLTYYTSLRDEYHNGINLKPELRKNEASPYVSIYQDSKLNDIISNIDSFYNEELVSKIIINEVYERVVFRDPIENDDGTGGAGTPIHVPFDPNYALSIALDTINAKNIIYTGNGVKNRNT